MPGSAATTAGIEFTACIAVAMIPGLRSRSSSSDAGCRPWKLAASGGTASKATSKRSPSGPKVQAGSRWSVPMSQLTRTVTTGSPPTVPCQVMRWAATVPASSTPTGVSIGRVATAVSMVAGLSASSVQPSAWATRSIDWPKPSPSSPSIGLAAASSGALPNSMISRTTNSDA